ncbi:hypothetical protein GQ55_1G378500 [Panicum hallii var. hallii]|uniref:Uncharacterized protein n=1 Tax=Panicum hallii var. hallii TaxID=1504633 RepID=A0A2T7FBR6_9POAL|nr:hypothetical protein GQ55_1G378500 [Panicum hallii var. hallii]
MAVTTIQATSPRRAGHGRPAATASSIGSIGAVNDSSVRPGTPRSVVCTCVHFLFFLYF